MSRSSSPASRAGVLPAIDGAHRLVYYATQEARVIAERRSHA